MKGAFLPGVPEIADGRVEGNKIAWSIAFVMQVEIRAQFSATLNGNELAGRMDAGRFGKFSFKGARCSDFMMLRV